MKIQQPSVIIFDLDGTLAPSKQPLESDAAELLKQLLDRMPVAVMSGGDFPQFEKQFLDQLPAHSNFSNLFLFPTSAAECLVYTDGAWKDAYDFAFSVGEKKKIIDAIHTVLEKTGIGKGEQLFGSQIEDRGEQITFSALGQHAPLEVKSVWDGDHAKRTILQTELKKIIPEFEINIGGTTSIDITEAHVSKEDGVRWLQKHFGVPVESMLYVGDALFTGGNDAAVLGTGIQTKQVSGPEETKGVIEGILKNRK